jgi:hypothetical protein
MRNTDSLLMDRSQLRAFLKDLLKKAGELLDLSINEL